MTSEDRPGTPEEVWKGIHKLQEECAELILILSKLNAFPDGDHPSRKLPLPMVNYVQEEMGHVKAAMTYFTQSNNLDEAKIQEHADGKLKLYAKWGGLSGVKR